MSRLSFFIFASTFLFALPIEANAAQDFKVVMSEDGNWDLARNWRWRSTSSDPGNGEDCAQNGSTYPSEPWPTVFDTDKSVAKAISNYGPPFSGSTSKTVFFTTCYVDPNNKYSSTLYITAQLSIEYSGCGAWICNTKWISNSVRSWGPVNDPYWTYHGSEYPDSFEIAPNFIPR